MFAAIPLLFSVWTTRVALGSRCWLTAIDEKNAKYGMMYIINQSMSLIIVFDGRCGVVLGILAYYARGRGFDSRKVQTFVCMNMSVCIGVFGVSMYLQKEMYISIY
jgi:hypothetical protein